LRAQLDVPTSVAVDNAGNLLIGDTQNRRVRRVSTSGIITTVAGIGIPGYSGDGQAATLARITVPSLATDSTGNIFVGDMWNNAIRVLKPFNPAFSISSVTSAGSSFSGAVSPGEIVVLYGAGLGPSQLVQGTFDSNGLLSSSLAGTTVSVNGIAAPIVYTSSTQVAVIVPYSISGDTAEIVVKNRSDELAPVSVPIARSTPGLFTRDGSGGGQLAAINQNNSINSAANPAHVGEIISLYATGEGQTNPPGVDGKPATLPYPKPVLPVSVRIGGQAAQVQYVGGAPGQVAGVLQVNVRIPDGLMTGNNISVELQVGATFSQPRVTIVVAN
jgi:uncharacterized protein (TIGR03437 family)